MYKFEPAPLTVSGLLKTAWALYKASILSVLIWTFIIAILHVIPNFFNIVGFYHLQAPNNHLVFSAWALLLYLVLLFIEAFCVGVLFYSMYFLAHEQKIHFFRALKESIMRLIPLYIAMIIYFLIVNLGMFLFLLPAVFFAVIFSMFIPFILIERQSIYSAFDRSVRLVWGNWWQTFFVLIVPYFLTYLGRNIAKFTYLGISPNWLLIADFIILVFTLPYFYSVLLVQYNNLKIIKSLPEPITQRPRTEGIHKNP